MPPNNAFVTTKIGRRTAILSLATPAENSLSAPLRAELLTALTEALSDPQVDSLVLTSDGLGLSFDLPLKDLQSGQSAPDLAEITETLASAPKPIVAALRGRVAYAGLELCLSAHARVAHLGARLCLPSLRAAQLPTAAALYTLAAQLGPDISLKFLDQLSDTAVNHPQITPLFDELVNQNAVGEAAALATRLVPEAPAISLGDAPLRRPAFDAPTRYQQSLQNLRTTPEGQSLNPETASALAVLEAAFLLPAEVLRRFGESQRHQLAMTLRSRRKTYQRASRLALLRRDAEAQAPRSLTLLGTSPEANRIALAALRADLPLHVMAATLESYERFANGLKALVEQQLANGHISAQKAQKMLSHLHRAEGESTLTTAEWVIEATAQSKSAIGPLIARINATTPQTCLVMRTSHMSEAAADPAPQLSAASVGLRLHPDLGNGALAEIVLAADAPASKPALRAALRRLGVATVFQPQRNGLASRRMRAALELALEEAMARGLTPEAVDAALPCRRKPFARPTEENWRAQSQRFSSCFEAQDLGAAPRLWDALLQSNAALDPAVSTWRKSLRYRAQHPPKGDDLRFLMTQALLAAGLRLLKDKTLSSPWEVDHLALTTLGFSDHYAGPFFETSAIGLTQFHNWQKSQSFLRPKLFDTGAVLTEMIKNGRKFARPGL